MMSSSPSSSDQPWGREGKEEGISSISISSPLCLGFKGDIKITIMSAIYFSTLLWKWCKNITFQIIFTKIIKNENLKIVIK